MLFRWVDISFRLRFQCPHFEAANCTKKKKSLATVNWVQSSLVIMQCSCKIIKFFSAVWLPQDQLLGNSWGDLLAHLMLINSFHLIWPKCLGEPRNEVGFQILARRWDSSRELSDPELVLYHNSPQLTRTRLAKSLTEFSSIM